MSDKLTEAERELLRDLQAVLKKHDAQIYVNEADLAIEAPSIAGLYFGALTANWIEAESFSQADIDGAE